MIAIVLADSHGVIHSLLTIPSCTPEQRAVIEGCAAAHDLRAFVRPAEALWTAEDAIDHIASLYDAVTDEVEAYVPHDPSPPIIEINRMAPVALELDWEEMDHGRP
jgi:hypothetical protein